uniref:Uncharacterized protein n=1 Tax=Anguilla anguilla TaxID=7936 RepID=A0A0E9RNE8_ANGAN
MLLVIALLEPRWRGNKCIVCLRQRIDSDSGFLPPPPTPSWEVHFILVFW